MCNEANKVARSAFAGWSPLLFVFFGTRVDHRILLKVSVEDRDKGIRSGKDARLAACEC